MANMNQDIIDLLRAHGRYNNLALEVERENYYNVIEILLHELKECVNSEESYENGRESGYDDGYEAGHEEGTDEGEDTGRKQTLDSIIKILQEMKDR